MSEVSATISEEEINRLAINFRIIKFIWECLEKESTTDVGKHNVGIFKKTNLYTFVFCDCAENPKLEPETCANKFSAIINKSDTHINAYLYNDVKKIAKNTPLTSETLRGERIFELSVEYVPKENQNSLQDYINNMNENSLENIDELFEKNTKSIIVSRIRNISSIKHKTEMDNFIIFTMQRYGYIETTLYNFVKSIQYAGFRNFNEVFETTYANLSEMQLSEIRNKVQKKIVDKRQRSPETSSEDDKRHLARLVFSLISDEDALKNLKAYDEDRKAKKENLACTIQEEKGKLLQAEALFEGRTGIALLLEYYDVIHNHCQWIESLIGYYTFKSGIL